MKFSAREETFVLVKPDVLERALFGRIFQKFEDADLNIEALKAGADGQITANQQSPELPQETTELKSETKQIQN